MTTIQTARADIPQDLAPALTAMAQVARKLSDQISNGALSGALGAEVGDNADGDRQKALDVIADDAFAAALRGTGIRWYASEEQDDVVEIDRDGTLALAIDPLDGSSNIDVNISIGTIFSIQPALDNGPATFLRDAHHLRAGGYFIYGPQTALVVTFGDGVRHFVLDRKADVFVELPEAPGIAATSTEYAINASNYRHWPAPVRAYVDDCLAGEEGPRGKNFNMRWVASLVAETHRIMMRGGVFLYPADAREGYEHGRLRLVYECAPIAFLIEQAGGKATTGIEPIMDQVPTHLHARVPFVFGSADKIDRIISYHDLPEFEVSALFGKRGLFRV